MNFDSVRKDPLLQAKTGLYEKTIGFTPDVIVVLSAGTIFDPKIGQFRSTKHNEGDVFGTLFGEGRVLATAELASYFPEAKIITTSKRLPGEPTHAQIVRDELVGCSVAASRIVLEENSINTLSQVTEALRIIFRSPWKNVVFVTSEYQLQRTELFFKHFKELLVADVQNKDVVQAYEEKRIQVSFVAAEGILTHKSPTFAALVEAMRGTSGYKIRLENEARGVQNILNRAYGRSKLQDKFERNM